MVMLSLLHVLVKEPPLEGTQLCQSYFPACLRLQSASCLHACSAAFAFASGKNDYTERKSGNPLWSSVMRKWEQVIRDEFSILSECDFSMT